MAHCREIAKDQAIPSRQDYSFPGVSELLVGWTVLGTHWPLQIPSYDPNTNSWFATTSMAIARDSFQMVRLLCRLVLAASRMTIDVALASAELYNPNICGVRSEALQWPGLGSRCACFLKAVCWRLVASTTRSLWPPLSITIPTPGAEEQ